MPTPNLKIIYSQFDGGIANDSKSGLEHACRFSRNLDIYSDSDSVSLNPIPIKDSGSVVTGLVKWIVDGSPYTTNRYAYDDAGNIYQITSGGVWSNLRTVSGGAGQGLAVLADYLYYTGSTTLGRYGPLSGTPAFSDDFYTTGTQDVDQSQDGAYANTYTVPTSITENATNLLSFTPTHDPIKSIAPNINARGTGNWTVTVHDVNNNLVGTATIANASLPASGSATFTFATPLRVIIAKTYHFHITSTVADGTVVTNVASDLSTISYNERFSMLVPDTDYHPIIQHTNGVTGTIVVGNSNYFGVFDGSTYNPNKITLEPGFRVRGFVKQDQFVIGYCWRGVNIDSTEEGRGYFWDGITSTAYNYSRPITGGLPNAMVNFKNRILSVLGSSGNMNLGTQPFRLIQPAPKLARGKKIEVLPGAIDVWQSRAHIGIGANTDDSSGLEQGVYEFGNQSDRSISYTSVSTEVLNNGYQISTGTTKSTTLKIGCVKAFGKDLYISWKDNATYGVDKVSKTNNPAATGSWESLYIDKGVLGNQLASMPMKSKSAVKVVVTSLALPVGCTILPKYRVNRATTGGTNNDGWQYGSVLGGTAGTTRAEVLCSGLGICLYKEIEIGFDLTATVNYPTITSIYLEFDPLINERDDN